MNGIEQVIAERNKAEGKAEEKVEIAKKMLKFGEPLENIVALTGLTLGHVQKIQ